MAIFWGESATICLNPAAASSASICSTLCSGSSGAPRYDTHPKPPAISAAKHKRRTPTISAKHPRRILVPASPTIAAAPAVRWPCPIITRIACACPNAVGPKDRFGARKPSPAIRVKLLPACQARALSAAQNPPRGGSRTDRLFTALIARRFRVSSGAWRWGELLTRFARKAIGNGERGVPGAPQRESWQRVHVGASGGGARPARARITSQSREIWRVIPGSAEARICGRAQVGKARVGGFGMVKRERGYPSPVKLLEDLWAGWRSYALFSAVELDLFSHIAQGRRTIGELAGALGASERGVERLCDAMVAMGYLRKNQSAYTLSPLAETYLVRTSELYMEGLGTVGARALLNDWTKLKESVVTGKPVEGHSDPQGRAVFFRGLVTMIFPLSYVAAQAALKAISPSRRQRLAAVLDVGAGTAAWSLPFARLREDTRVTAIDFPPVLEVTRQYVARYGLEGRYEYVGGDFRELDFGKDRYDLVILGHIVHGEGPETAQALIAKSAAALREQGMILLASYIPNYRRTGPPLAVLFGLNMLLHAPSGNVYTLKEYRAWLKAAGMKSVKTVAVPAPSPVILASK